MKKILIVLSMLFIASPLLFAKEIFRDAATGKEYLFLGSVSDDIHQKNRQKKLLDLKNNAVVWLDEKTLQQSDQLTPGEFLNRIFKSGLLFHADGSTPHWQASLSEKKIWISKPDGKTEEFAIKINLDKDPMDGVFLLMFQSKDHQTYGVIRKLGGNSACDINNDGSSFFEVFINTQGKIMKGCAALDKR